MSQYALQLPDSLYANAQEMARRDNTSLDQFVAMAVAEKISALTTESYFQERASRGDKARYLAILDQVPDGPVQAGDELPG